jgi:hypothetical protein
VLLDSLREGYRLAGVDRQPGPLVIIATLLSAVFGVCVVSAIAASVLIHLLGWWIGVPVAAAVIWVAVVWPRTGIGYRLFQLLRLEDSRSAEPAQPVEAMA